MSIVRMLYHYLVMTGGSMMKRSKKILITGIALVLGLSFTVNCYAKKNADVPEEPRIEEPRDPRIEEAYDTYLQALEYAERGDRNFMRRAGTAQTFYERAEDYFLKAAFQYEQLGIEHNADMADEIKVCEKLQRIAHVKTGKARKKNLSRHGR